MTLWHRAMFSKRCSAWQRKELLSNQAITWTRGHDGSWMWASAFAARAPLRKVGPRLTVMLENLENWPIYDVAPSSPHEVNTDNLSWILALQLTTTQDESLPYHEKSKCDTLRAVFQGQGCVVVVILRLHWRIVQHRRQKVHLAWKVSNQVTHLSANLYK